MKPKLSKWRMDDMTLKTASLIPAFALSFLLAGCGAVVPSSTNAGTKPLTPVNTVSATAPATAPANTATAVFAGGCFWCMEKPFDQLPGVLATVSGYTGGRVDNPTYEMVGGGSTGHIEAVQVTYDPARITYTQLLDTYWAQVDPFDGEGQFCDKGETYKPVIFAADEEQRTAAEVSKAKVSARFAGRAIAVDIRVSKPFWPAEDYHQDYYLKNPLRYTYYRNGCGRDARLRAVWSAPSVAH
jgi:peptide-methionine (S)-S-oxide reductase